MCVDANVNLSVVNKQHGSNAARGIKLTGFDTAILAFLNWG